MGSEEPPIGVTLEEVRRRWLGAARWPPGPAPRRRVLALFEVGLSVVAEELGHADPKTTTATPARATPAQATSGRPTRSPNRRGARNSIGSGTTVVTTVVFATVVSRRALKNGIRLGPARLRASADTTGPPDRVVGYGTFALA